MRIREGQKHTDPTDPDDPDADPDPQPGMYWSSVYSINEDWPSLWAVFDKTMETI